MRKYKNFVICPKYCENTGRICAFAHYFLFDLNSSRRHREMRFLDEEEGDETDNISDVELYWCWSSSRSRSDVSFEYDTK